MKVTWKYYTNFYKGLCTLGLVSAEDPSTKGPLSYGINSL